MVCLQLHATPITDLRDLVSASSTLTRRNPPIFFLNVLRGPSNFPGRFEKPACSSFFPIRSIGRYSNGILPNGIIYERLVNRRDTFAWPVLSPKCSFSAFEIKRRENPIAVRSIDVTERSFSLTRSVPTPKD